MSAEIVATDTFEKSLKKKKKKFQKIIDDLEDLCQQLENNPELGDAIEELSNKIWKVRMKSSDMKKSKKKGFRIIYFYDSEEPQKIYLLDMYAKFEKANISKKDVRKLMKDNDLL